jgi:hypothetical protein
MPGATRGKPIPWSAWMLPPASITTFHRGIFASSSILNQRRSLSAPSSARPLGPTDGCTGNTGSTPCPPPQRINLPHADLHGDGIPNTWRSNISARRMVRKPERTQTAIRPIIENEYVSGTDPLDAESAFQLLLDPGRSALTLNWIGKRRTTMCLRTPPESPFVWSPQIFTPEFIRSVELRDSVAKSPACENNTPA